MRVGGTERPQRMDKVRRSACACSPKEQNTDTTKVTRRMAGGGGASPKYWRGVSRRSSSRWRARGVTLVWWWSTIEEADGSKVFTSMSVKVPGPSNPTRTTSGRCRRAVP